MRFFGEYDGLFWEFESVSDWLSFLICRFIGKTLGLIIGIIIIFLIIVSL